MKSSFFGLIFSFQIRIYRLAKLNKYGPPWKTLSRSSTRLKMAVKNPLDPNLRETSPLGFHLVLIHHIKDFYDGQRPMNFHMRARSCMYWISPPRRGNMISYCDTSFDYGMQFNVIFLSAFGFWWFWAGSDSELVGASLTSFVCYVSIQLGELEVLGMRAGGWGGWLLPATTFRKEGATPPWAGAAIANLA
jgi:hypothetical protein